MRAASARVAKTTAKTTSATASKKSSSVSKKAPSTQHIQWRGKRITLFGNDLVILCYLIAKLVWHLLILLLFMFAPLLPLVQSPESTNSSRRCVRFQMVASSWP